jgi:urease accessory protein
LEFVVIVEQVFKETELPESSRGFARDTVTLGWEDRTHVHGRRRTDGGVEFGTSLPRGSVLRDGDRLVLDAERLVVAVVERAEPVFVVEPRSPQEWGLFAYHIGNLHQPLMITDRSLVCPDAPGVEQLLRQHRMPYARAMLPFTPAARGGAHQH